MPYEITFERDPDQADLGILVEGLNRHREKILGRKDRNELAFFLRDETDSVVGGVNGNYGKSWLYINALWIREDARGFGYGRRLVTLIENEAIEHGCTKVFLNTMSYEAPEFYKKLGYTVFGELEDFPDAHSRIFMRKALTPAEVVK